MKPLDTVVYWLDEADANDPFCEEIVLFSIGQYSNLTLSTFIWHSHLEHTGLIVVIHCGFGIGGVMVPFHRLVIKSNGSDSSGTGDISGSISLVRSHYPDARIGFVLGTTTVLN